MALNLVSREVNYPTIPRGLMRTAVAVETIADKLTDCAGFPVAIFESDGMRIFSLYDGISGTEGFVFQLYSPGRTERVICEFVESPIAVISEHLLFDSLSLFAIECIKCLKDQVRAPFERAIALMAEEASHV